MNRRKFVGSTLSALYISSLDNVFAGFKPFNSMHNNARVKILATSWGLDVSPDTFCSMARKEGYDGIEAWWPSDDKYRMDLFSALKKHKLEIGFLCGGSSSDFQQHLLQFRNMTTAAATSKEIRPLYINCHSGRDHFSEEQNQEFISMTTELSEKTGLKICHETHRSRILYAAHVAKKFLTNNKQLRITFDVSHWCNVHESYLEDQQEAVELALQRTEHIHARIGHPEGPQVNDPRAPEWEHAVQTHVAWWDKVVERKRLENDTITFLTEFGPPDYMPTMPHSRKPLSDQWAINVHMLNLLRKRYA